MSTAIANGSCTQQTGVLRLKSLLLLLLLQRFLCHSFNHGSLSKCTVHNVSKL